MDRPIKVLPSLYGQANQSFAQFIWTGQSKFCSVYTDRPIKNLLSLYGQANYLHSHHMYMLLHIIHDTVFPLNPWSVEFSRHKCLSKKNKFASFNCCELSLLGVAPKTFWKNSVFSKGTILPKLGFTKRIKKRILIFVKSVVDLSVIWSYKFRRQEFVQLGSLYSLSLH